MQRVRCPSRCCINGILNVWVLARDFEGGGEREDRNSKNDENDYRVTHGIPLSRLMRPAALSHGDRLKIESFPTGGIVPESTELVEVEFWDLEPS